MIESSLCVLKSLLPAFPSRPSRGLRPRTPLRRYPIPSCAVCPGRTAPLYALLRGASEGCRAALEACEEPWGGVALGGSGGVQHP